MKGENEVNVLLVDDREDGLVALEAVLSPLNLRLVKAKSGAEALGLILEIDFAVIVLDVQMPEMDGFETAALIKKRERSKHIPILFVTAINKDPRFVYQGYEVGAVDYLFKPFDPHVLRSKVSVFVELYLKNRQLERQAELLRASEAKVRLLLESAWDTIATLGPTGRILSLSDAFFSLTGWEKEDWIDKPFEDLLTPHEGDHLRALLRAAPAKVGGLWEFHLLRKEGQPVEVEASVRPLLQDGGFWCLVIAMRDVTQRKKTEEAQRRASELERSNRELEQFATICSHDLQEPLRVISNFVPLLERRYANQLDENGKHLLSFIQKSSKRMSELVRDLLHYSRLGSEELSREELPVESLVVESIQNLQVAIQESGAKVLYEKLPVVSGNRPQLVQLFQNLIGNAIKFRGNHPLEIHVDARLIRNDWVLSVKDNGIGIDDRFTGRIFDIFRRLHSQEQYPGTGVGLAVCKKVIDRHGGRIWVESTPSKGSTFYFTLPAHPTERWQEPKTSVSAAEATMSPSLGGV